MAEHIILLRSQFAARVRTAIDEHPVLGAIIEPTLHVLETMRAQLLVYDRAVIWRARDDATAAADVGAWRRHYSGIGLYDRCGRSNTLQAIIIGGGVLRHEAQALPNWGGRSRRPYLQMRRWDGPRPIV
jgi:hypothetical protein